MVLYLIGLGLGDERDITLKGLEAIKRSDLVFLEHYTSVLGVGKERLEESYGKKIILADRTLVEQRAEAEILEPARARDVAFLVVGDPFGATTHMDLVLRAKRMDVPVRVIHNASIINAVGEVGLELYKFGAVASIPFHEDGFEPETPYDIIRSNQEHGWHTLCLLDIKVCEPGKEELLRGTVDSAAAPRFMTIQLALETLLKIERTRRQRVIMPDSLAVGVARLGCPDQHIIAGTVDELLEKDFARPLHALILPGRLHVIEEEALQRWR
jgi:diphthine methyl ester synthase